MRKIAMICLGLSVISLTSLSAESFAGYGDKKIKDSSTKKTVQTKNNFVGLYGKHQDKGSGTGSDIEVNKNVNLNLLSGSKVTEGSSVGMKVKASGSKVKANENTQLDLVNNSNLKSSDVGLAVEASQ
ncbi:MAG TPA: hypothetical protein ENK88_08005 [Campylobacterales bacterium]|nr:hypothetical protein [Arcobacter sp.]HHB95072.1 hypothetical protein [Campylobacterales bacterium]